jgi:hypothetical protein
MIQVDSPRDIDPPQGPAINVESSPSHNSAYSAPNVLVYNVPGISVAGPEFDDEHDHERTSDPPPHHQQKQNYSRHNRGALICGGCDGPIIGRIVSAMSARWHPQCFRCTVCNELLEHVSSYEHEGKPYCHLDYHEVRPISDSRYSHFFIFAFRILHPGVSLARLPLLRNDSSVSMILHSARERIMNNISFVLNVVIRSSPHQ